MIADKDEALFEQCLQRINHESFLKDEVVCSIGKSLTKRLERINMLR